MGKSTLAWQIAIGLSPGLKEAVECEDYALVLRHCSFDFPTMIHQLEHTPFPPHFYDEASLLSREAMTPWNIRMVKALSIVGLENKFFLFNFPDFWALDPYIRDHRCRTRVYVWSFRGHRGFATFYARRKFPFKNSQGRSVWWVKAFEHRFTAFDTWADPYVELWHRYREQEGKVKMSLIHDEAANPQDQIILNMVQKGYSHKIIADAIGKSRRRTSELVSQLRKEGKLEVAQDVVA